MRALQDVRTNGCAKNEPHSAKNLANRLSNAEVRFQLNSETLLQRIAVGNHAGDVHEVGAQDVRKHALVNYIHEYGQQTMQNVRRNYSFQICYDRLSNFIELCLQDGICCTS